MTKHMTTFLAAGAGLLALAGLVAAASPAASAPATASRLRVVPIVMKDPGCHWFRVAGKDSIRLTVNGPTAFRNLDEATVTFTGNHYFQRVAVHKTLVIAKAGVYRIKMVGQHHGDNILVLTVR